MAWIFMGFGIPQYKQCLLLDLLHQDYLKTMHNPSMDQLRNSIRAFNEERGESSLSLLTASVLVGSDKSSYEKLDMNYSILNFSRTLVKDYTRDFKIKTPTSNNINIKDNEAEVEKITEKTSSIIEAMIDGTWRAFAYHDGTGLLSSSSPRMEVSHPRFLIRAASFHVEEELKKIPRLLLENNYSFLDASNTNLPASALLTEEELELLNL
jgi:hypothetical protein